MEGYMQGGKKEDIGKEKRGMEGYRKEGEGDGRI